MNLPAEIAEAVVKAAGKELAAQLATSLEDLRLFTFAQAADRLGVHETTARKLFKEHVDLGEASRRVSAAQLRTLIERRTVSKP